MPSLPRTTGRAGSIARVAAFDRTTALRSGAVVAPFAAKQTFSATELERFADCSSAWLVERVIDPKKIDAEPDPILRGSVLHTTLNRFYASLPRELDAERVTPENLEAAIELAYRCLDAALESGVRLDLTELQEAELRHSLRSDLEGFLRDEAASEVQFLPRRLEVAFGSERAAPELQRGLPLADQLWLSGKIDRIDVDPFSARGIVQDYKSGKGAHSAREIDREFRLQIPLYILALRDLVGVEPLGGVYRALAGRRLTRGMLRETPARICPASPGTTISTRTRSGARSRPRAIERRTTPGASRRATCATIRRATAARRGAISGRSAGCRGRDRHRVANRAQRGADRGCRGRWLRLRLRRRGHRQDVGARRAVRPRRLRARRRRRVDPRDHVHAEGCGRATDAHPLGACASAGVPTSRASSTEPGSPRSTASAHGCSARIRSPPVSIRASGSSRTPALRCCAARRSIARSRNSAPEASPSGSACSRRTVQTAFAGC